VLKPGLEHHIPSSARPAAPDLLYVLPTFRWERQDEGNQRTHIRHGKAVRVWLRRPWFSSGDGEQLGVLLEPGVRLPREWVRVAHFELTALDLARRSPQISRQPLRRLQVQPNPIGTGGEASGGAGSFLTSASSAITNAALSSAFLSAPPPSPEETRRMLQPYITAWGSDPVWRSALPEFPPTVAAFPRHSGYASGLTLEELPPSVAVVVAAHDVFFDRGRRLWYCDIEIDPGDTYFPFVRLALARYQAHSLNHAHLSRVVMTDFIQLTPDRTAEVQLTQNSAHITVQGFSGRNILSEISPVPFIDVTSNTLGGGEPRPNTMMRVALERRIAGMPGDLGWERVGSDLTLPAAVSGFHVTWTGTMQLTPQTLAGGFRLLITEVETYLRDLIPGDPMISTSPLDFVRERVVYADTFEL
jgi:hypothetical protein